MHRVNTIDQLKNTPVELGVEVDIRSENKELIVETFNKMMQKKYKPSVLNKNIHEVVSD